MKIAIIGFSKSSYDDAPWDDPSWEKWGMPWDGRGWQRYTRLFEMHSPILWDLKLASCLIEMWDGEKFHRKCHRPDDYYPDGGKTGRLVDAINSPDHKVYFQEGVEDVAGHNNTGMLKYPFERVIDCIGADYFQSSVAYALALAITEIVEADDNSTGLMKENEIALYGIDASEDTEWGYQRACLEYLIGIARGYGIKVFIPESSALCKFQDQTIKYGAVNVDHTKRYGIIRQPQTFQRWTPGEMYSLDQLAEMDLPEDFAKKVQDANLLKISGEFDRIG